VVERHIIQGLDAIFSPIVVAQMSAEEIADVVSEPPSITHTRESLEARKKTLEKGRNIFRKLILKSGLEGK
jgi:hypothetical protein